MTTVAVLADPPRPGLVYPRLVEESPLDEAEVAELYAAAFRDVCRAVETSGGDLLVNYRDDADLPGEGDSEAELRETLEPVAELDADDVRFEVQVGGAFDARAGNTVTHLLEREGVPTAAVVEPTAAFLTRPLVDEAAMKLRRRDVVLGPASGGRVYYAGFGEPVDFDGAYTPPEVATLTDRGLDAGLDVDYLRMAPVLETGADLAEVVTQVRARRAAGRNVPGHVTAVLDSLDPTVVADEDGLRVER